MRYLILFFCVFSLFACQEQNQQHDLDIQLIKGYIATHNIPAIEDNEENYFYDLYFESGDSIAPILGKGLDIEVSYKAYLLDGTVVSDVSNYIVELDDVIYGWKLAIPKMNINDKMRLLLPSRLAYGSEGQGGIPANSVVIFDIELVDIFPHF
ncbi:FKBP-type peptidyl-prolyl cis-trans isomerase [Aureispira anguillae]|uniref:Peptidyl-prolyl cis-trans isomerase n=1 Tax=Aureispira anguillae TaxID=2864201 RepID=A0A916DTI3_9BACT|nr:FKBP-type peptidyl-prolyl cis-trans isomerase [Aureispira anguillae]BDS11875.1 FKBP-type peptidyl-prolyl cis-trans isomerase [Aureispira anguillae]